MTVTRDPSIIQHSAEAARGWYADLADELGTDDPVYAAAALRAVLHALRDRLPVDEAAQFAAQMPTLIRGVYYEQWRPGAVRELAHTVDEFLGHVAREGRMAGETEASLAVAAVVRLLRRHISAGELDDVLATMPAKLRPLLRA